MDCNFIGKHVVVTTDKDRRGVFGGVLASRKSDNTVILKDARMAVRWSTATHGVLGLAGPGPDDQCRITHAVPTLEIDGVTSVSEMTAEAIEAWSKEPWG